MSYGRNIQKHYYAGKPISMYWLLRVIVFHLFMQMFLCDTLRLHLNCLQLPFFYMNYKIISIFLQFTFAFYFGSFKAITWLISQQQAGIVSLYYIYFIKKKKHMEIGNGNNWSCYRTGNFIPHGNNSCIQRLQLTILFGGQAYIATCTLNNYKGRRRFNSQYNGLVGGNMKNENISPRVNSRCDVELYSNRVNSNLPVKYALIQTFDL